MQKFVGNKFCLGAHGLLNNRSNRPCLLIYSITKKSNRECMKVTDIKKLQQKKYREQFQCFLLEGEHLVLELFKAAQEQPHLAKAELFITEQYQAWLATHNHLNLKVTVVSDKAMSQLSDTKSPQGIVAVVPFLPMDAQQQAEKAIYLHEIQDPGNLGTILRTLAWFGGFRCYLSTGSVDPYNPKVVRSSMGAIFHVPIVQDATLAKVQNRYPRIAYLDMQGADIQDSSFNDFDCYAFGNEARGVPHELLKAVNGTAFTITGAGKIESLNLGQAVGMSVFRLTL